MSVTIPHYLPVKNAATSVVPPFGVMYGSAEPSASGHLVVDQPTDCTGMKGILVNDAVTIPREPYGYGQGHKTFPAVVAYEEQDGTPAYGEYWGPTASSWKIRKGRPGFLILGGASDGLVNVDRQPEHQRWQTFLNGAAQTASAYGVLRITGNTACVVQAARPNGTYTQYAINGPHDVTATTGRGICTQDYPATALYDSADGTPANGQVWGPGTDTFKLKKHFQGYVVVGDVDTTATTCVVVLTFGKIKGKLAGALSYRSSASMTIWTGSGAGTSSGVSVTVWDWCLPSGETISSGINCQAYYEQVSGIWVVDAAEPEC